MRKHVVFCSLQNSGLSAIHPIIYKILFRSGWGILYNGKETQKFTDDYKYSRFDYPMYHFSHDKIDPYYSLIDKDDVVFIYNHRDPRDAVVSQTFFTQNRLGLFTDLSFYDVLYSLAINAQPELLESATKWIKTKNCLVINFEQIKENTTLVIYSILNHISYFELPKNEILNKNEIDDIVCEYSFENQTNRKRGSLNKHEKDYSNIHAQKKYNSLNKGMWRNGISGEWKLYFDQKLFDKYHEINGDSLLKMGYTIPSKFYEKMKT